MDQDTLRQRNEAKDLAVANIETALKRGGHFVVVTAYPTEDGNVAWDTQNWIFAGDLEEAAIVADVVIRAGNKLKEDIKAFADKEPKA